MDKAKKITNLAPNSESSRYRSATVVYSDASTEKNICPGAKQEQRIQEASSFACAVVEDTGRWGVKRVNASTLPSCALSKPLRAEISSIDYAIATFSVVSIEETSGVLIVRTDCRGALDTIEEARRDSPKSAPNALVRDLLYRIRDHERAGGMVILDWTSRADQRHKIADRMARSALRVRGLPRDEQKSIVAGVLDITTALPARAVYR